MRPGVGRSTTAARGWGLRGGGLGSCLGLGLAGALGMHAEILAAEQASVGWEFGKPRISNGAIFEASTDGEVQRLAERLDAALLAGTAPSGGSLGAFRGAADAEAGFEKPVARGDSPENEASGGDAPGVAGAGRLLPMPRLNATEQREFLAGLRLKLGVERGYREVAMDVRRVLPPMPGGVSSLLEMTRRTGEGMRVVRVGIHPFVSRSSELWCEALRQGDGGDWVADPEVETLQALVQGLLSASAEPKPDLTRDDLAFEVIQISYIDTEGALEGLKGFGIQTAESPGKVTMPVPFRTLPLVARMPSPDGPETALLGADAQKTTAFDLSVTPSMASALPPDPNLSRASQLLVYFHPAHPDQLTRVRQLLEEYIDRPAQQIFIEGLVLEISEEGLKELGVDWQYKEGGAEISVGNIFPGLPATSTAGFTFDSLKDLEQQWVVRLRALIEDQKAEVLSRPSVLTLNNRQATIRVGQEIPIATSSEAGIVKDANRISFNFKYLPTGISLNIRPRLNEDGSEVSMLVDTVVSSAIPGADLELRSSSGEVLASAPTVATRRVQTYTRIGNNTPFIIGGLVNREQTSIKRKVPLLGDIPYLGALFRSRTTRSRKQEVIIVLTPHVLPEALSERAWGRYLPRDDDKFDDVGNTLFRASYRIREEDVFDLSFLDRNERLRYYRERARKITQTDYKVAARAPVSLFLDGRTPGENVLVQRMLYEVLKRLSEKDPAWLDRRVAADRLIFFSGRNAGGYDVQFLENVLAGFGDGQRAASFFEVHTNKAVALVFQRGEQTFSGTGLGESPIPEIRLLDCPDRKTWNEQLWALNQADAGSKSRTAILIHRPEDLVRLQRAVLLREVIHLNGGPARVTRKQFSLGQVLLVPDENPHETRLLDHRVAELFLHTEHYYAVTLGKIEEGIAAFDRFLDQPEYRHLK